MFTTLVSTSQLADRLGEWLVVDCRFDLANEQAGRDAYLTAHIPGAIYASLNHDLSATPTGTNGRHPLPSVDTMTETFSRIGIVAGTQVIAYDADSGMYASRLWWMLRYLGHDAVAVLDGGFARWTAEKRAVETGNIQRPRAAFVAVERRDRLVTIDEMVGGTAGSALLVDARAPERFEGRSESLDPVAGHIPGAVNRFFKDNLTPDGVMRSPQELKQAFRDVLQDRDPTEAVMYCGSGVTACQNLLALEHAGLSGARLFVGSWSEWCADADRGVATGPAK